MRVEIPERSKAVARDDVLMVDAAGFRADKTPCWDIRGCVAQMCRHCPAYLDQSRPSAEKSDQW